PPPQLTPRHAASSPFMPPPPLSSPLSPYTPLFRSRVVRSPRRRGGHRLDRLVNPDWRRTRHWKRRGRRHFLVITREEPVEVCGGSEEHTSELQSLRQIVCRLLLDKKKGIMPCGSHQ